MTQPTRLEHIETLVRLMGLTDDEFSLRKKYLEITDADAELLRSFAPSLQGIHTNILDSFYAHLLMFPQTRAFLQDPVVVERLRRKQEGYFADLIRGQYDQHYMRDRLGVGLVHHRIGLESRWYIGAYAKFLITLLPELKSYVDDDIDKTIQLIAALLKVVFLDINLVLDTYALADKQSIQALKEHAENLICNIPLGLLVIAQDMSILSANSFLDSRLEFNHHDIKGVDLGKLLPGSGLRDRASEVLASQQPQIGIQLNIRNRHNTMVPFEVSISPMHFSGTADYDEFRQPALLLTFEDISEHAELISKTAASDNRVRAIMESVAESIITIDESGIIESVNPATERLFGFRSDEMVGKNIKMLMPSPYKDQHDEYLKRFCHTGVRRCLGYGFREVEGLKKSGTTFPMELSISELHTADKRMFIGIIRDITERKRDEAEMAKLSLAIEQTADSIIITDAKGIIEYVNAGFEKTTGYMRKEVIGKTPNLVKSGMQGKEFYKNLWSAILNGQHFQEILINRKKDGSLYYEEKTITPLRNHAGTITHFVSTGKDITDRMRAQERLHHLAHHDLLTDLPNRLLFMDRLTQAIPRARRTSRLIGLLFLDLDRFKKINDTLGHHIGDALLRELSQRFRSCLREDDTIARLSGDEFAVLLPDLHHIDDVIPITNKILAQFQQPFQIDEHQLYISTSIGIAIYPNDGNDPATLLKNADTAMYSAKGKGRGLFSFYTPDMNAMAEIHLQLENELRHALDRHEFSLIYQPQYSAKNHTEIIGAEALLRWTHPDLGSIAPSRFIPLLDDTGLIIPVGEWVIRTACKQLRSWQDKNIHLPSIAVNIAPRQLNDNNFLTCIKECLREYRLAPNLLEIEITENSLMEDEHGAINILRELSKFGVRIAMDDFGTGYSSLSYLRKLPVSTLKIDRSFISRIPHNRGDNELVHAIVAMGHTLNLRVIAEGIENREQLDYICAHGCDGIQGYLLGRPVLPDMLF